MTDVRDTVPDCGMDAGRIESLREQVAVHATYDGGFRQRCVAKPPAEYLCDHFVFVKVLKDLGNGRAREVLRDTERFDLAQRSQTPVTLHVRLGSRAGERGTAVIQRAFTLQERDGLVDLTRVELAAREAGTHLRFAQFSTSQHAQACHVRAGHLPA